MQRQVHRFNYAIFIALNVFFSDCWARNQKNVQEKLPQREWIQCRDRSRWKRKQEMNNARLFGCKTANCFEQLTSGRLRVNISRSALSRKKKFIPSKAKFVRVSCRSVERSLKVKRFLARTWRNWFIKVRDTVNKLQLIFGTAVECHSTYSSALP